MLKIDKAPEPESFTEKVGNPGEDWLQAHPQWRKGERMPDYWKKCADELFAAYHGICAFTLMRIEKAHGMEMDHFRPKSDPRYRSLAYQWGNFRLVSPRINRKKGVQLLADPFKIPKDAVKLRILTDGKIYPTPGHSPVVTRLLQKTIDTLELNDGGLPESRMEACDDYLKQPQELGICRLTREYPFVAYEMLRQGMINVADRDACLCILKSVGFSWIAV